jgi:4-amino-4-deoxy-L-arabinose transferase-like glycosyltransferase
MSQDQSVKPGATISPKILFLTLVIFGFVLRMGYGIVRYRGNLIDLSGVSFITSWNYDGLEHVLIAKALLSREGYVVDTLPLPAGKHIREQGQEALFKAPLYQFFLAAVFAVSGFSFKLFFPLQALFGGLTSGLVGLISWEAFQRPDTAWISGFAAAVHPVLVNAASQPYNEDLFFFLFAAAVWFFLVWFRKRDLGWALLCGVSLGLCTLTRESAIPLLAAFGIIIIVSSRDLRSWMALGAISITCLAVIAPWTIRNYVRFHAFVPVASIVGEDLATGNNECVASESFFMSYWAEGPCIALKDRVVELRTLMPLHDLPPALQFDRLSRRAALDFIQQYPLLYAKLAIRRLWTSLLPYVPRGNQRRHERIVLTIYWLAVFPPGWFGLFLSFREGLDARIGLLALIILLTLLSIMAVLYWSDLRFRLGIDLLLGCFAAWFWSRLLNGAQNPWLTTVC